jgi:hypothetical protein
MTGIPPPSEDIILKGYDPDISRRLVQFGRPYRWSFLIALILMVFTSVERIAWPILIKIAIDFRYICRITGGVTPEWCWSPGAWRYGMDLDLYPQRSWRR